MATNQFMPFATDANANLTSLSDWINDTGNNRTKGNIPDALTSSALNNRAIRQSSLIASALGELCVDNDIDLLDTGNPADTASSLSQLFVALSTGSGTLTIAHNDTTNRDASDAHPISAITDLSTTLSNLISWSDVKTTIGSNPTNSQIPTNAAVKSYAENLTLHINWGDITGTISNQTDLMTYINNYTNALNNKVTGTAEITEVKVFLSEQAALTYSTNNPTVLCFYPI